MPSTLSHVSTSDLSARRRAVSVTARVRSLGGGRDRGARVSPVTRAWLDRPTAASVVGALVAAGVLVGLVALDQRSRTLAIAGAAAIFGVGLFAYDPVAIPLLAIPGTVLVMRLGGSSVNLSFSDFFLFVGAVAALPFVRLKDDRALRSLLWLVAAYEITVVIAVIDHPYRADWVEWIHEGFLSGGSLLVGWVVGRAGRARAALSLLLAVACALAIWACAFAVSHHFIAANLPLGYQKNFVGDWIAFPVVVAIANPDFVGWGRRWRVWAILIGIAGIAASGSRQAVIGLVVALVIVNRRGRGFGRYKRLLIVGCIIGLGAAAYELQKQLVSSNRFNSAHQRLTWYKESLQLLHLSPILGEGLRWWYTARFSFAFAPPNAELEILTSAGLVGLCGFLILHLGALEELRKLPKSFGTIAFAVLIMRLVQTQVDEFWLASQSSLPWMIVGLALGAMVLAEQSGGMGDVEAFEGQSPQPWDSDGGLLTRHHT
jgi:polysaccharide biosynthesis protein PslJ